MEGERCPSSRTDVDVQCLLIGLGSYISIVVVQWDATKRRSLEFQLGHLVERFSDGNTPLGAKMI